MAEDKVMVKIVYAIWTTKVMVMPLYMMVDAPSMLD